jgi:hypothetical protein
MSTIDELSKSQTPGRREGSSRVESTSRPAVSAKPTSILSAAERDELHLRIVESRARTKELVALYLTYSGARQNGSIAHRREEASLREEARAALSASVARYAVLLRSLGEPPERTLVSIKTAFTEAAPLQDQDNRAALEDVVRWIVEAYYSA